MAWVMMSGQIKGVGFLRICCDRYVGTYGFWDRVGGHCLCEWEVRTWWLGSQQCSDPSRTNDIAIWSNGECFAWIIFVWCYFYWSDLVATVYSCCCRHGGVLALLDVLIDEYGESDLRISFLSGRVRWSACLRWNLACPGATSGISASANLAAAVPQRRRVLYICPWCVGHAWYVVVQCTCADRPGRRFASLPGSYSSEITSYSIYARSNLGL